MEEPDYLTERDNDTHQEYPKSIDSERVLLGACLTSEICLLQAIELLVVDDLFSEKHKRIFAAMMELFNSGTEINPISIAEILKQQGQMHYVGGVGDIAELTVGLPYIDNINSYAELILSKSQLRKLITASNKITREAIEQEDSADTILAHAETAIYQLTEKRYKTQLQSIDVIVEEVVENAMANAGSGLAINGIETGLSRFDLLTGGLQKSDYILLAARPSVGKTAEAVTITNNLAVDYEKTVAFFSLEMAREALVARLLCNLARVDFQRFRKGLMLHEEWDAINQAKIRLSVNRIFIDDKPAISLLEARAKLHRLERTLGAMPDLIIFDYLQLMSGLSEHRKESRQQEVSGISAGLKAIAKELDRPVVALSQLNRGPAHRSDKSPQLTDLRESGTLEQDADLVAFIHRIEQDDQVFYEQILAKNRNGPCDSFGLAFNGPAMRFDNLYEG